MRVELSRSRRNEEGPVERSEGTRPPRWVDLSQGALSSILAEVKVAYQSLRPWPIGTKKGRRGRLTTAALTSAPMEGSRRPRSRPRITRMMALTWQVPITESTSANLQRSKPRALLAKSEVCWSLRFNQVLSTA
jgi:hypothetical protein